MIAPDAGSLCVTDKPQYQVCLNEWIISVGQRFLIALDENARHRLETEILPLLYQAPQSPPTVDAFLLGIAARSTQLFLGAGANVVVVTDSTTRRPFMTHRVRDTIPIPDDCADEGQVQLISYGCTNNDAAFPLVDPDLDLAASTKMGLSLDSIYKGWAIGSSGAFETHTPQQQRNANPLSWSATNLPPNEVFRNRFVNLATHEMAHGFGLVSPQPFRSHADGPVAYSLNAINAGVIAGIYWEQPATTAQSHKGDLRHEPIKDVTYSAFRDIWLMQTSPFKWRYLLPNQGDSYDNPDQSGTIQKWLLLDHPGLRFSLSADYDFMEEADRSIERFFRERIPLCTTGRMCR
ncbi:MAG: hypothetical protein IT186_08970 [Acidobacteria bacterium]|nr:hypothetical protein [Acidobacteriota bacterium]